MSSKKLYSLIIKNKSLDFIAPFLSFRIDRQHSIQTKYYEANYVTRHNIQESFYGSRIDGIIMLLFFK